MIAWMIHAAVGCFLGGRRHSVHPHGSADPPGGGPRCRMRRYVGVSIAREVVLAWQAGTTVPPTPHLVLQYVVGDVFTYSGGLWATHPSGCEQVAPPYYSLRPDVVLARTSLSARSHGLLQAPLAHREIQPIGMLPWAPESRDSAPAESLHVTWCLRASAHWHVPMGRCRHHSSTERFSPPASSHGLLSLLTPPRRTCSMCSCADRGRHISR